MNVSLPQHLQDFVSAKVRSGDYANEADVLANAVGLMKEYEDMRRAALRVALQEGLDSGPPAPFDFDEFMLEVRQSDPPDVKP